MVNECQFCGRDFVPTRGIEQQYCSISCGLKGSKPQREVMCEDCDTQFTHYGRGQCKRCPDCRKSKLKKTAAEWGRKHRTVNPGVGSGGSQWGVDNPAWTGGESPYVGDYRSRCFKTHDRKCNICGKDSGVIDVHHIDGDKINYAQDNLVPLCRGCHKGVHYRIAQLATKENHVAAFEQVKLAKLKLRKITGTPGSG